MAATANYRPETLAVRAGQERSQFGEHSEALYLTSSFVFESAAQAAKRFSGEEEGNVYARFSNPTVSMFEERLAALEGAEDCVATASGMSAIMATVLAHLKQGDHIVASNSLFGATVQLFNNILSRTGITTTFVSHTDPAAWEAAIRPETRLFFLETPSNPLTEIADISKLVAIAHAKGILVAVDNCFCTPILQKPLELGADLVIHSATKYIDGQGRVLGGAVCGPKKLTEEVFKYLRTAGPTLSAFNAWVLLKGLETLKLRVEAQAANAARLANWLEAHPRVARVSTPACLRTRSTNWPRHSRRTGAASYPSRSRAGASRRGPSLTIANYSPSPPIWATSRPPLLILPPPRTAAFPWKPGPPPASTKVCCALLSALKRWKTCRPISSAASPLSDI